MLTYWNTKYVSLSCFPSGSQRRLSHRPTKLASTMSAAPSLSYVVGNTYRRLRKRRNQPEHEWVLYLDVVQGDEELLTHVQFHLGEEYRPATITCHSPVQHRLPGGTSRTWRFSTPPQTSTRSVDAVIKITGRGGTVRIVKYNVVLQEGGGSTTVPVQFIEPRPLVPLKCVKIDPSVCFGVELELSCAQGTSRESIANAIQRYAGISTHVVQTYAQAHDPVAGWKLVHDGSIVCSRHYPNCSRFELVSPVLKGGEGLNDCNNVLKALARLESISVNKSMGFHVHISVEGMSIQQLVKVSLIGCALFALCSDAQITN